MRPPRGRIQIRVLPEGQDSVRIEVEDDGPGVPSEDRTRIFDEFEQLDHGPAKRQDGTGLGLALAKRFVEAHGGRVGVEDGAGGGSLFYAVLPRGDPKAHGGLEGSPLSN